MDLSDVVGNKKGVWQMVTFQLALPGFLP